MDAHPIVTTECVRAISITALDLFIVLVDGGNDRIRLSEATTSFDTARFIIFDMVG
jgi:hypothetical protein